MEQSVTLGFFDNPVDVLTIAAQSPLGITALVVIVVGAAGIGLFKNAPPQSKLIAWLALVASMITFVVVVTFTRVAPPPAECSSRTPLELSGVNLNIGPDDRCTMIVNYRAVGTFVRGGPSCGVTSEPVVVKWKGEEIGRWPGSNFEEASVNLDGTFSVPKGVQGQLQYERPGSNCSDPKPNVFFGLRATVTYR